ncbi:MAG: tetratricopeptide repeat protein [Burkholderiales bacterium]|jgi:tetratricopeptide (TPR) repeat protein
MRSSIAFAVLAIAVGAQTGADDRAPKDALKHYRAGQLALQTERYAEAEAEFRKSIDLDPLLVAAHYGLGQTMMATKSFPEAVTAYVAGRDAWKRGQELAATDEMAMQRRINDQIKALQDDVMQARSRPTGSNAAAIDRAISRNEDQIKTLQSVGRRGAEGPLPTPHWLSFALGSAYFRTGDLAKAEVEYRSALEQKPDLGEGHLNLGVVCLLTGRLDEAESEVALAEKAGVKVPQALKDDIAKRRAAKP